MLEIEKFLSNFPLIFFYFFLLLREEEVEVEGVRKLNYCTNSWNLKEP